MIIIDRIQRANVNRKHRDDVISQVSAMRDSGKSIAEIAETLGIRESSIRAIIKHIL